MLSFLNIIHYWINLIQYEFLIAGRTFCLHFWEKKKVHLNWCGTPCCKELNYLCFLTLCVFPAAPQCFSCATCRNRLMPGDRFHYINGTIFCEHDRPGAALLNSHMPPLQSNSVLTDQKVNKKGCWHDTTEPSEFTAECKISLTWISLCSNVNNKICWFPLWEKGLQQQDMVLIWRKNMQQCG